MRRIRPCVVITARQYDDSGHDHNTAISCLATTAFDRAYLKSLVPLSSRLCYLVSYEIIRDHDVALSRGLAAAPMIRINITDYLLTKAHAVHCHMSQLSPHRSDPDQEAEELEPYEGFILVRPPRTYADMTDLLSSLIEKP